MTVFCIWNSISLHSEGLLASLHSWSSTFPGFGCYPDGTSRGRSKDKSCVPNIHLSAMNYQHQINRCFSQLAFPDIKESYLKYPQFHPISKTWENFAVYCLQSNSFNVAVRDPNKHCWTDVQLAAVICRKHFTADIKCSLWSSFCVLWRLIKRMACSWFRTLSQLFSYQYFMNESN